MHRLPLWFGAVVFAMTAEAALAVPLGFSVAQETSPAVIEITVPPQPHQPPGSGMPIAVATLDNQSPGQFDLLAPKGGIEPTPFVPIEFRFSEAPDPGAISSLFDMSVNIGALQGSTPVLGSPMVVVATPPDLPFSFFDVFFDVKVDGGIAHLQMRFAIDPAVEQELSFVKFYTELEGDAFDLKGTLLHETGLPPLDPGLTLFAATLTGTFQISAPATAALVAWGPFGLAFARRRRG